MSTAGPSPSAQRCCLSVPASDERKVAKALGLDVDEIVFDLEDGVAPGRKAEARSILVSALSSQVGKTQPVAVRINQTGTQWCLEDVLACVAEPRISSIVVPKVESSSDVHFIDRLLDGAEAGASRQKPLKVQVLIESAQGLANLRKIAKASRRITSLILGYADLAASLGTRTPVQANTWLPAQHKLLTIARATGLNAIDGPYLLVDSGPQFLAHLQHAAALGFDGTWVIHPGQISTATTEYTPPPAEIARARRILSAMNEGHSRGVGAVSLDGQMLDEALAVSARRVLARSAATTDVGL
ncbi:HpcH/HpaI aldolase/citrate lyase family protein [Arthrobacter sp. UNC362MFTsu5.1]|uniref:HpcH/HpaI aldolase/citrate lyase family protein n=1 Tax=Arthrobacter sp. UNC362MFTsu5.1 TaxID=1449044 RepID=UPI0009DF3AE0|nr:CoA ester lyase [Arthrobacter sp. UNC362MFTsu5.1]